MNLSGVNNAGFIFGKKNLCVLLESIKFGSLQIHFLFLKKSWIPKKNISLSKLMTNFSGFNHRKHLLFLPLHGIY